ncbi:LysE family translocator [Undibacterium curvum]|uniref:LysE family translocator n=1 Tax=Undibacterium curvum TaxID=2762294 RepID=UPI003D14A7FC
MNDFASLIGIAAAIFLGAASPGPSFLMVARTAASTGRSNGLSAALGMGVGALLFAVASLLGVNAIFLAVPKLYMSLKIVGGLYLVYLGVRIWRGAKQALDTSTNAAMTKALRRSSHFFLGFATQVSNPKTAIVYASVFVAFLPATPSIQFCLIVAALVFVIEAGWYAFVATALSSETSRGAYLRYKKWVDRSAGGIMGILGVKLATSASHH